MSSMIAKIPIKLAQNYTQQQLPNKFAGARYRLGCRFLLSYSFLLWYCFLLQMSENRDPVEPLKVSSILLSTRVMSKFNVERVQASNSVARGIWTEWTPQNLIPKVGAWGS